jgi:lipopolysaccharide export system protein LptA
MDATGHVVSSHKPDKNQKPGTSMLDTTQSMQAQAGKMFTRENNARVHYEEHAVIWQGANRTQANTIDIDRDAQSLTAHGDVVSELVDNRSNDSDDKSATATAPIFTVVHAPDLSYRDDTRVAHYTGGVKLTRMQMVVTSNDLTAYLTPKTGNNKDQSALDHAIAEGNVKVFDQITNDRTRTGTAELCQYFTKDDKVVLSGGSPEVIDSYKGVTRGRELTYYEDEDRLLVDGEKKQLAYTRMKKK